MHLIADHRLYLSNLSDPVPLNCIRPFEFPFDLLKSIFFIPNHWKANAARISKYVLPFFNITYERVKGGGVEDVLTII